MKKLLYLCMFGVVLMSGCSAPSPEKTSLEIQAIQAQTFDTSKKIAFNAIMSVLQDLGYIIQSASLETGFVTADSPTKEDSSLVGLLFVGLSAEAKSFVTVSVEEITPMKTRIRLNFLERRVSSNAYGKTLTKDKAILNPVIYQKAFDKIGEEIFIRKSSR